MKKILYFITTSNWGGAANHVYELCRYEVQQGNRVYLIVGSKGELYDRVKKLNVHVLVVDSVKRNISPFNDIKSIFKIRKIIKKINPDIIHLHSSKAGVIGRLACYKLKNVQVIFTVHGWSFTDGIPSKMKKNLYKIIEKCVAPLTDYFICVSEYDKNLGLRDNILKHKENNYSVIHNGTRISQRKRVLDNRNNKLNLIMTARFSSQKNQRALIKAVSNLDQNKYKLSFIGNGPTEKECKNLCKELNLTTSVDFLGFKDNVGDYLDKNDIFVLSSYYEGLPISIIEAMAHGLPVIASNVGGNSELVENKINGFLVNDEDELLNSIKFFINNPQKIREMGKKSKDIYMNEFTLEKNLKSIDSIYNKLIA
ncbi:glycosyltransferase family 4 protein [Limosilactobacillus reuteri]|uniref:glycosyltransferase family 4 protein n=1 Tax=Limosilactobacillus reuteri TaxID=1598 RepID=UPI0021A9739F|nr:glycosyltransferase family 4 protein [Limosilactobacillus reuteri]MCT3200131.1 glycosyltransferase family 1 protein [Limosilactobacillus reuteri]